MMKKTISAALITSTMLLSNFAFAQDHGLTRAQVVGELAQLEQAGYSNPGPDDHMSYPTQLQAAEQRVAAANLQSNYAQVRTKHSGDQMETAQ